MEINQKFKNSNFFYLYIFQKKGKEYSLTSTGVLYSGRCGMKITDGTSCDFEILLCVGLNQVPSFSYLLFTMKAWLV